MAIRLEFVNLIIPIQTIEEKCPGGWKAYLDDNVKRIGKVMWYDSYLVRATGCMCSDEVDGLIARYVRLGLTATHTIDAHVYSDDFCVVDSFGFSRHCCNWLTLEPASSTAWLTGTQPGEPISRDHFR